MHLEKISETNGMNQPFGCSLAHIQSCPRVIFYFCSAAAAWLLLPAPIFLFVTESQPQSVKDWQFLRTFCKVKSRKVLFGLGQPDSVARNCYWGPFQRWCLLSISSSFCFIFHFEVCQIPKLEEKTIRNIYIFPNLPVFSHLFFSQYVKNIRFGWWWWFESVLLTIDMYRDCSHIYEIWNFN